MIEKPAMGKTLKNRIASEEYLGKAKQLSEDQAESLLSRMRGRTERRFHKEKISTHEALAIQLEIEAENLAEWREKISEIREKENKKDKSKK